MWTSHGIYHVPHAAGAIVRVPVTTHPSVSFGTPVELPRAPRPGLGSREIRGYDVLPDGRIVSIAPRGGLGADELAIWTGWTEELKRLVR